jgi:hypothetical protein
MVIQFKSTERIRELDSSAVMQNQQQWESGVLLDRVHGTANCVLRHTEWRLVRRAGWVYDSYVTATVSRSRLSVSLFDGRLVMAITTPCFHARETIPLIGKAHLDAKS